MCESFLVAMVVAGWGGVVFRRVIEQRGHILQTEERLDADMAGAQVSASHSAAHSRREETKRLAQRGVMEGICPPQMGSNQSRLCSGWAFGELPEVSVQ